MYEGWKTYDLPLLGNFPDSPQKLKSDGGYSRLETAKISETKSSCFGDKLNFRGCRLRLETVRIVRYFAAPDNTF